MNRLVGILSTVVVALAFASNADAQIRERWRIHWNNEKPKTHSHYDALNNLTNYWYFTFELKNPSDQAVPIMLDVMLYVESAKDLMNDVAAVDVEKVKKTYDKDRPEDRPYQEQRYGRFYNNIICPEAEHSIIEEDLRLGNRLDEKNPDPKLKDIISGVRLGSEGIREESIRLFKEANYYLNPRELRKKAWLQPGETVRGVAIFKSVDTQANIIEIQVSGLVDPIKIVEFKDDELTVEYENQVLRQTYEFRGDPFERETDVLLLAKPIKWEKRKIGPLASKDTIDGLLKGMVETYKKEKKWIEDGLDPKDIDAREMKEGILRADVNIMARAFQAAINKTDFGYDYDKSVVDNKDAMWRMHEWWTTWRGKYTFDKDKNYFVIDNAPLSGKTKLDDR